VSRLVITLKYPWRAIYLSCRKNLATIVLLATLVASAKPAHAQSGCSVLEQNAFVRDTLQNIYLWYQHLPGLDPALYDSPEAYLEAVRYRPLDASFSHISSREASTAFYSESQYIGIGLSLKQTGATELRVSQVFPDSPASEVRLARGDYLLSINGRSVAELLSSGELGAAFGPDEIGVSVELAWRALRGDISRAVVSKRPVTIPTVSHTEVFDLGGLPVGYLHFRNFVTPSVSALDRAFAEFRARGVVDVILDLRYNGGGLVEVARHLGGLIGGMRTNTQVFVEFVHNDKNTFRNQRVRFNDPPEALDLPRLVVIATRATASSSELVVNGLRPFLPVTLVGDSTFGKPVGQYGYNFCDKTLFPVSFQTRNAQGEGDYFGGLPRDCAAPDELERAFGDPREASLAEALNFLRTGSCSPGSVAAAQSLARLRSETRALELDSWRQLLNAW
jgi:carboxyl-terminal processing protease